jgi:hypothetical protein
MYWQENLQRLLLLLRWELREKSSRSVGSRFRCGCHRALPSIHVLDRTGTRRHVLGSRNPNPNDIPGCALLNFARRSRRQNISRRIHRSLWASQSSRRLRVSKLRNAYRIRMAFCARRATVTSPAAMHLANPRHEFIGSQN